MNSLVSVLKKFSLSDVREVEEEDRQFRALKKLYSNLKNKELFFKLVLVNALLSYQLQMKGEDYWEAFSEFFSGNPSISEFPKFLKKFNKRFLPSKLKRLERALNCVNGIFERYNVRNFGENLKLLVKELSKCMKQKENAKTIVFSAKMFLYAYRIVFGKEPENLESIEIPLDSRLRKLFPELKTWRELSNRLKIPPIRLDALIWVTMGMNEDEIDRFPEDLRLKLIELKRAINGVINGKNSSDNGLRREKGKR
jgi:DNA-(apurinic or apyrimidinic site) lyase